MHMNNMKIPMICVSDVHACLPGIKGIKRRYGKLGGSSAFRSSTFFTYLLATFSLPTSRVAKCNDVSFDRREIIDVHI